MNLIIATDPGFELDARALSEPVGQLLASTYPGYRWRVEPHPHPTKPFVDIRLEAGHAMFGATIKPWQFYSASSYRAKIVEIGGELLERFHLNRRAFDETEFVARKKNFAGIILPDL
jgi:hypothetical protein